MYLPHLQQFTLAMTGKHVAAVSAAGVYCVSQHCITCNPKILLSSIVLLYFTQTKYISIKVSCDSKEICVQSSVAACSTCVNGMAGGKAP